MTATDYPVHEPPDSPHPNTVHFGLAELDLLTTHAGVRMPYPVRIPSYGRTAAERGTVLAMASATLASRKLANDTGPTGLAAELVTALRTLRHTLDLVLTGTTNGPVGVLALRHGTTALLCRQPLTPRHTNQVTVTQIHQDELATELSRHVPRLTAATVVPISLAPGILTATSSTTDEQVTTTEDRLRTLTSAAGGDPEDLDRLAALLPSVTSRGQLGATTNGRRTTELSWLDSPTGRVRIDHGSDGWVSVNPLHPKDIHRFIRQLTSGVTA